MRKVIIVMAALFAAGSTLAQTDSTKNATDTIISGEFVIIKKDRDVSESDTTKEITRQKKRKNVSTNWMVLDIGFANHRDETAYGSADANSYLMGTPHFTEADMSLRTNKSSNVNIWFFMQTLNVSKHALNLKYGLGYEMYNFRYKSNISYNDNPAFVYRDSVNFSKNKLFAGYLTVPFMVNINTTPHKKNGLSFGAGVSAGYLVNARNKQISRERGKQKTKGDFDLEPWRLAYIAEVGLGPIKLYGSYSINPLHERGLKQYPFAVGIRISN